MRPLLSVVAPLPAPARADPGRSSTPSIILIFAEQATRILDNLGPVFRTFVPMILYFTIMWTGTSRCSLFHLPLRASAFR